LRLDSYDMEDINLVFKLKSKYGSLYSVYVKNTELIFRELTFFEYEKINYLDKSSDATYADVEDFIIETAIVHPEDFDINKIPPGNVSILSQEILDISGFHSAKIAKNIMDLKREQSNEVKSLMKAFVLATITAYSPEDLENMTFSQLAEKVALSEKVIEIRQGMNGIEPTGISLSLIDPEEEMAKERDKAERHNTSKMPGAAEYDDPIAKKLWGSSG